MEKQKSNPQSREKLVSAFVNRLESITISDFDLIPALENFIENGDYEAFEDYSSYRRMDVSTKKEMYEDACKEKEEYEKRINDIIKSKQNIYDYAVNELRKLITLIEDFPPSEDVKNPTAKHICEFLNNNMFKDGKWSQRGVYVKIGDKLKIIKSIHMDDKGACILDIDISVKTGALKSIQNNSSSLLSRDELAPF